MTAQLQTVLRLIHIIQKERGASCALVGNAVERGDEDNQYKSKLRSARTASNSAISSFYKSSLWVQFCGKRECNCISFIYVDSYVFFCIVYGI